MLEFKPDSGEIETYQSIPEEFKKFHKAGAIPICLIANFARFFFQKIECHGFDVWYSVGRGSGHGHIFSWGEEIALELRIALSGMLEGKWDGISYPALLPYFCNLSFTPHVKTDARLRPDRQYEWLDIQFEEWYLKDFGKDHPQFEPFIKAVIGKEPIQLGKQDFPCTPRMKMIIYDILHSPYNIALQKKDLESQVSRLLTEVFQMAFYNGKQEQIILLPHHEIQIKEAYSCLMSQDIDNPLSNSELCRKFNVKEEVLLKGMRKLCNKTPKQLTLDRRFAEAEKLLLEGDLPTEVAYKIGFARPSHFFAAFQKRYKCTPTEFRQSKGKTRRR